MTETAPLSGMESYAEYAEAMREIARTGIPPLRLSAPAVFSGVGADEWSLVEIRNGRVVGGDPQGWVAAGSSSDQTLRVVRDRSALRAILDATAWPRRMVAAAFGVPGGPFVILADALDRKFWLPTDPKERTAAIARIGGVDEQVRAVRAGVMSMQQEAASRAVNAAVVNICLAASRHIDAYSAATTAQAHWARYVAIDQIGQEEAIRSGRAALVEVEVIAGGIVVCRTLGPCRLREGAEVTTVRCTGRTGLVLGAAKIDRFDVDETDEMRVIITSATGTKTISRGVARMRVGDQITLVEKAFAGPPLFAGRWARLDGGDGSSRQVPLAITLMGSPVR